MLQVEKLHQYYGGSHILRGLSFEAKVGEVTCLLGRNGVFNRMLMEAGIIKQMPDMAKLANDGIAQMVAAHPKRLRGLAHIPMQDPDAAIIELERVVKKHNFKGVEVGTSIEGLPLADYDEAPVAAHLAGQEVRITVDLGLGHGRARVWTCDLTHGYIAINADYRS